MFFFRWLTNSRIINLLQNLAVHATTLYQITAEHFSGLALQSIWCMRLCVRTIIFERMTFRSGMVASSLWHYRGQIRRLRSQISSLWHEETIMRWKNIPELVGAISSEGFLVTLQCRTAIIRTIRQNYEKSVWRKILIRSFHGLRYSDIPKKTDRSFGWLVFVRAHATSYSPFIHCVSKKLAPLRQVGINSSK